MEAISSEARFAPFLEKMTSESLSPSAIAAFRHSFLDLLSGSSGMIRESEMTPVSTLPYMDIDITGKVQQDTSLLKETVVLKLNGGLGTSAFVVSVLVVVVFRC